MKKLSKVLSVICALVLVASLGVTAFAETTIGPTDNLDTGNTATGDVTVAAPSATAEEKNYKIVIDIPDLVFTYNAASKGTWDTEGLKYDNSKVAGWAEEDDGGSAIISITNYSNDDVTAAASYDPDPTNDHGITVTFAPDKVKVDTADNNEGVGEGVGLEKDGRISLSLSTPSENFDSVKVGTVTVKITAGDTTGA